MLLIHLKTAFEMLNSFFEVFLLLANHTKIEESIDHRAVWNIDSTLEEIASIVESLLFLIDTT